MKEKRLRELHSRREKSREETEQAVRFVRDLESDLDAQGIVLDEVKVEVVQAYIQERITNHENTLPRLLAIARYFYIIERHDIYIYFASLFGGLGVIESIKERLQAKEGEDVCQSVFRNYKEIPLGTDPKEMPKAIETMMNGLLETVPPESVRNVLAGNNHGIPKESMNREKEFYEAAETLDDYLLERHQRKVKELQEYCDRKQVWYEQEITQEVVDYVKGNQEILSAVREGDTLYVTKIPYDGSHYLEAEDEKLKSYYACHCPFARESIMNQESVVSPQWCYCSGGFAKFPFEVLFDRELEVELLKSALAGDVICRFAIKLPKGFTK